MSEGVQPIRYYVDPGAPEDVRKALIEGASWWNQAFEGAGFHNAFQVAVLPDGVGPMDIRYNVINWVHRSTRGWSTGFPIIDPRTGEVIKATVTLGSLRDRQDFLILEGLLSPYTTGNEKPEALYQNALPRIRQLAAHEVGQTLGLMHSYYDSRQGGFPLWTIRTPPRNCFLTVKSIYRMPTPPGLGNGTRSRSTRGTASLRMTPKNKLDYGKSSMRLGVKIFAS